MQEFRQTFPAEEEVGPTRLREQEENLEDVAWNAVVIGYPNRFEDVGEASGYAVLLAKKLIERGDLPDVALPFTPAMLVGLLWFLWSDQQMSYLAPEVAEDDMDLNRPSEFQRRVMRALPDFKLELP